MINLKHRLITKSAPFFTTNENGVPYFSSADRDSRVLQDYSWFKMEVFVLPELSPNTFIK